MNEYVGALVTLGAVILLLAVPLLAGVIMRRRRWQPSETTRRRLLFTIAANLLLTWTPRTPDVDVWSSVWIALTQLLACWLMASALITEPRETR